jgi:acyl-CoA thioesterase-1
VSDDPAYLLRFQYLESVIDGDPHLLASPEAIAALRGLSVEEYEGIRAQLTDGVSMVAAELLSDQAWRQRFDELPWRGGTVAVAGDSITADLQSWARILEAAMRQQEAHGGTRMINLAVDGDTSAGLLSRLPTIMDHSPEHVLIMIGANDGQGHADDTVPWISDEETQRNLEAVGSMLTGAGVTVTWLAPPRIRVPDVEHHWYLGELPIGWSPERQEAKREIVLRQPGLTYDTAPTVGDDKEAFLDGLHPSLEGQKRIAKGLVEVLSTAGP